MLSAEDAASFIAFLYLSLHLTLLFIDLSTTRSSTTFPYICGVDTLLFELIKLIGVHQCFCTPNLGTYAVKSCLVHTMH